MAMYRAAIETSSDGFWLTDAEGRILEVNDAYVRRSGYTREELLAMRIPDLEANESPDETALHIDKIISKGNDLFETRHRAKNGTIWQVEINASYWPIEGGLFFNFLRDITGRRQVEKKMHSVEQKYRRLIELTDTGYVIIDSQGMVLDANQRYADLTGSRNLEEIIGHSVLEWTAAYDQERNAGEVRRCILEGGIRNLQVDYVGRNGTITPVEIHATVLDGSDSFSILSLCRDITERRKAEDRLRVSERRLKESQEVACLGSWDMDIVSQVLDWSDQTYKLFDKSREVFVPSFDEFSRLVHPEDLEIMKTSFNNALKDDATPYHVTVRIINDSGREWVMEAIAKVRRDEQGNPLSIFGTAQDITVRKHAEDTLRASERMLNTIINTEPECVKLLDENANLIMMNRAGLDMIQADSLEQVKGQCVCPLVTPEYRQPFMDLTKRIFRGGSGTLLFETIGLKGRHVWLETHAVPLRNDKDEIIALLGVTRDVTERKQFEQKLRQSEEFVRGILDTVDEGFIVVDRDYNIVTANRAYCRQVEKDCDEIIGRHCYEMSHQSSRPCFEEGEECATRHTFEKGLPHTALHRHKDARGNIIFVETKAYPIKDDSGRVTSVIETINNITEKYLLEEERLKTQKLESIGTLAGGIAHDFNNLLQGVFGYISMAKLTHDQKEKSLAMLEQAEEALHLSVNLTTQLLTFSKGGKPVKKLMRLGPTVENAVKFALSGSHTDYRLTIDPELWPVEADEGQLAQVIQNIVLNANEAMAGRGTVNIAVTNRDIPAKTNSRLPDGGRFICIDIQDSGIGISDQNLSRIFDPYFTTKQKGSGLGLATSYSIIRNHGGIIEVMSELHRGTTFTIYLPASKDTVIKTAAPPPVAVGTKKLRLLLMDDEELVRSVAQQMLSALGHTVVGAEDGEEAIKLFRQAKEEGRPFDLVVLDLTVKGGMGGEETIEKIREIDPEVKAIVSSGYADSPVVADYRAYGFSAVLNKPYRLDALQGCLNQFLS